MAKCYEDAHSKRVSGQAEQILIDPYNLDLSQNYSWRHKLNHNVKSVFWLFLYWAMVVQPE